MATVQHVTKASSDRILSKFAELDDAAIAAAGDDPQPRAPRLVTSSYLIVKRKRSRRALAALSASELASSSSGDGGELPITSSSAARRKRRMSAGSLMEWKSLLPSSGRKSTKAPFLLRRIGIGRSDDSEGLRSLLLAALEKTFRRTFNGASKMFIDKHGDDHAQLISNMV